MGVTASTPTNIVFGAGNLEIDETDVGATSGDNGFRIEQTINEPELNGVPGALIGTQYKTREEAVLTAGMPEVDSTIVKALWPGASGENVLDWDGTRRIPTAAFHDYDLVVDGLSNTFHFYADNALNQGNIEYTGRDTDIMNPQIEAHSKWDAAAMTASPHRIHIAPLGS